MRLAARLADFSRLVPQFLIFLLQSQHLSAGALQLQLKVHLLAGDGSFVSLQCFLRFLESLDGRLQAVYLLLSALSGAADVGRVSFDGAKLALTMC